MATELGTTHGVTFTRYSLGAGAGCACQVSVGGEFVRMNPKMLRELAQHALRAADAVEGNGFGMDTTPRDLSEARVRDAVEAGADRVRERIDAILDKAREISGRGR